MSDKRCWSGLRSLLPPFASRGYAALMTLLMGIGLASPTAAATRFNATSPLGINLASVNYWSSEQPFLDIMKTSAPWGTHDSSGRETNEEQYLNLDANGWPMTLTAVNDPNPQLFTQVTVLLFRDLPNTPSGTYPAGQYVVKYLGQGTLTYNFDAVKVTSLSTPGRDVISVANPTGAGFYINITSTDPNHTGNYIRNIQVVKAEQESALVAGQMFNPTFLALLQNFRVLRFMDWFHTNGNTLSSWSNRALPSNATWATSAGVPYEAAVHLATALSADAWVNIPIMADNNFITQFATLVHQQLGNTQKAYVELSNEVWNASFPQFAYVNAQGRLMWPNAGSGADYGLNWYGMRVAQTCDIWKTVWGADSSRVVCVMGAQAAVPWTATEALSCVLWSGAPCAAHGVGAVAIAPYFGGPVPSAWTSQADGGLSSLIASLTSQNDPSVPAGGWLGQTLRWVAAYPAAIAKYNLPLIAYEGGQTFTSSGSSTALTNLYIAANRDPRMQPAYATYLQGWKNAGGQLFLQYDDMDTYGVYGEWGALESFMQTTTPLTSAPPKWQALQNFISGNTCWWTGCSSSTNQRVPMAPTSLTVH